ncbi:hypothetical protein L2E82_00021 [Cichorium intybus]|uniref:Uncharacterized protein n=1 Tax=Cichorium intybus TaxID=13427 RepID=A0ACB9GVV8_CICIN|nr:hypothetical protein L2E82_00021 [Cichorium intybus]
MVGPNKNEKHPKPQVTEKMVLDKITRVLFACREGLRCLLQVMIRYFAKLSMDTYMGRGKDDIENLVSSLIFLENEIFHHCIVSCSVNLTGQPGNLQLLGKAHFPCVGKSCLLLRFSDGSFTTSFITTIGIDFKIRTVELDGKRIKLQIWDTAGQERFRTITTAYYRGAMGILLVYDGIDESSFNNIRNWIRNIEQHASDNVNKILVGNKADMDERKRVVPTAKGQALADEYGIKFFETVHSVWAAAEAYSAPSIVLTSHSPEGLHVFDDFREAYAWLSHNTHVDDKVSNPLTS